MVEEPNQESRGCRARAEPPLTWWGSENERYDGVSCNLDILHRAKDVDVPMGQHRYLGRIAGESASERASMSWSCGDGQILTSRRGLYAFYWRSRWRTSPFRLLRRYDLNVSAWTGRERGRGGKRLTADPRFEPNAEGKQDLPIARDKWSPCSVLTSLISNESR